jgi:hypothetical protein
MTQSLNHSPILLSMSPRVKIFLALAATIGPGSADLLAESLRSVKFRNGGEVRFTDKFERLTQCNGFTECYTSWECNLVKDYLYDTTAGGRQSPTVPAVGMRSAMPLGGLGTGTFELRADGSFADWQVENQGPALATDAVQNSKLPLLEGALLGVKVGHMPATTLRTHPPPGLPAAEALSYSGAYPFARLGLNDSRLPVGLSANVFAFSAMRLHDPNASALPAVAFTLVLDNRGNTSLNASFMLTLPLASTASTSRRTAINDRSVIRIVANLSAAGCLKACGNTPNCSYWDLDLDVTPAVPAVPATPPQIKPDHDLGCNNLGPGDLRRPMDTISQCYAYCNATSGCRGFVWDEIQQEIAPQCKGTPGQGCCIVKPACSAFLSKKGDTAVMYGEPAVPAVPAVPGPGCVLHSGAPAVQQYRTKRMPTRASGAASARQPQSSQRWSAQTPPGWSEGGQDSSGVRGEWHVAGAAAGGTLTHSRTNTVYSEESLMDPSAAVGDFTLLAVGKGVDGARVAGQTGRSTAASLASLVSVATADSAADIWNDFAATGSFDGGVATHAGFGAVAATVAVAAGSTESITLVFAWRMPLRNYVGENLGNFYSEITPSSGAAATRMAGSLEQVAAEGAAFNQLFTNSTYPVWFQDFLLNSLATQPKMGIWVTEQCPKCPNPGVLANGRLPGECACPTCG